VNTFSDWSNGPPLLSIVIPTRNRRECLIPTIKAVLKSTRSEFELLVHDNSDTALSDSDLADLLGDSRVRYYWSDGALSMTENCDKAVSLAKGYYICMIGDDDGVLVDEALDLAQELLRVGVDAALSTKPYYPWPAVAHWFWGELGGRVYLPNLSAGVEVIDVREELELVLSDVGAGGLRRLPRVYHGFVSRHALNRLRSAAGTFFPGPSPDMANAVGLAFLLTRTVAVGVPLVIAGHSKSSGGGMGSAGKHIGGVREQAHLPANTSDTWHPRIPFFWSGPTIYAQSICSALAKLSTSRFQQLRFERLHAACLVFQPSQWRETFRCIFDRPASLTSVALITLYVTQLFFTRAATFAGNLFRRLDMYRAPPAENIDYAVDVVRSSITEGLCNEIRLGIREVSKGAPR